MPEAEGAGADALKIKSGKDEKLERLSREGVQREIDGLRKKLEGKKGREGAKGGELGGELGKEVERRKEELVQCLRVKDRRPLDCWEEVEGFKAAVGRLEEGFLKGVRES